MLAFYFRAHWHDVRSARRYEEYRNMMSNEG